MCYATLPMHGTGQVGAELGVVLRKLYLSNIKFRVAKFRLATKLPCRLMLSVPAAPAARFKEGWRTLLRRLKHRLVLALGRVLQSLRAK